MYLHHTKTYTSGAMEGKAGILLLQYIPSKLHRFGVKLFVLCNVKMDIVPPFSTAGVQHYEGLGFV